MPTYKTYTTSPTGEIIETASSTPPVNIGNPTPPVKDQTPSAIGLYTAPTTDDQAIADAEEAAFKLTQTPQKTDEQIRAETLAQFQSEIDSLNTAAIAKKDELARTMGVTANARVGSQRALLAGSGMLGQVSGEAEKSNLDAANAGELRSAQDIVDAERNAAVSALMGQVRTESNAAIAERKKAYSEGADALVSSLKNRQATKATSIDKIIKSALLNKIDLSTDKNQIDAIVKGYEPSKLNITADDITNAYKEAKIASDKEVATAKAKADKEAAEALKTGAETAKLTAETYKLQHPEAVIKEVDGGLYDVTNNKWLVPRKVTTSNDEYTIDSKTGKIFNKTKGIWADTGTQNQNTDTSSFDATISNIDTLLNSDLPAVGTNVFTRGNPLTPFTGTTQKNIADVEQIVSQGALDALISAKAQGATFGALSDAELRMLQASATKIGSWKKTGPLGDVYYDIDQKSFRDELTRLKEHAQKLKDLKLQSMQGSTESTGTATQYPDMTVGGVVYKADANGNYSPQ
jgi:hypothetical protein